ncbi:MAG: 4'-phosphopantetheinyl transferase superfamily protein, partial [Pseudomonadota bacterium]
AGGRRALTYDGVVTDKHGRVLVSLMGVEMMELKEHPPFPGMISEEIVLVEAVERARDQRPEEFITRLLTEEEANEYAEKKVPKRANEWIAGRVAAKTAVLSAIAGSVQGYDGNGNAPLGSTIRIVTDGNRKPIAELTDRPGEAVAAVSISHSNGVAMAAASTEPGFVGLGVDVEKVEERADSWVQDYFTGEEIAIAGRSDDRPRTLTAIWALKEAALKAIGTGLAFDMKDIRISELKPDGHATLEFRNEAAEYLENTLSGSVEACTENRNGLVIARVTIR